MKGKYTNNLPPCASHEATELLTPVQLPLLSSSYNDDNTQNETDLHKENAN